MSTQINIGQLATEVLRSGKTHKETLAIVRRVFPNAQTTLKGIASYASRAGIKAKRQVVNEAELAKVVAELKKAS